MLKDAVVYTVHNKILTTGTSSTLKKYDFENKGKLSILLILIFSEEIRQELQLNLGRQLRE